MKVLGKTDESDETSYANDAADDDDLEAYARREHGKVKVVFDLDATTYSDDFDHLHAINDDVEFLNNSDNERLKPLVFFKSFQSVSLLRCYLLLLLLLLSPLFQRYLGLALLLVKAFPQTGGLCCLYT